MPHDIGPALIAAGFSIAGLSILLHAQPVQAENEAEACRQAVNQAQTLVRQLPVDDPSRRFAENDLQTALTEAASGEWDECPELVARARDVIETRPYRLRPGERMHGYGTDQPR